MKTIIKNCCNNFSTDLIPWTLNWYLDGKGNGWDVEAANCSASKKLWFQFWEWRIIPWSSYYSFVRGCCSGECTCLSLLSLIPLHLIDKGQSRSSYYPPFWMLLSFTWLMLLTSLLLCFIFIFMFFWSALNHNKVCWCNMVNVAWIVALEK